MTYRNDPQVGVLDRPTHDFTDIERSTTMSYEAEALARAHMSARLHQARSERRGRQLAAARRLSRKAERAAAAARLALARAL